MQAGKYQKKNQRGNKYVLDNNKNKGNNKNKTKSNDELNNKKGNENDLGKYTLI